MLDNIVKDNLQYDIVDHEIIFDICKNHIPKLAAVVHKIIEN